MKTFPLFLFVLTAISSGQPAPAWAGPGDGGGANSCIDRKSQERIILLDSSIVPVERVPGYEIAAKKISALKAKVPLFGGMLERAMRDLSFYVANCALKTLPPDVTGVFYDNEQTALQLAPRFAKVKYFDYGNYKQLNSINAVDIDESSFGKLKAPNGFTRYSLAELQGMLLLHEAVLRLVMGGYAMSLDGMPNGPRWPGLATPITVSVTEVVRAVVNDVFAAEGASEDQLIANLAKHWQGYIFNVASNDPSFQQSPDVFNSPTAQEALRGASQFNAENEGERNARSNLWALYKPMLVREARAMDKYCHNPLSTKYLKILSEGEQRWNGNPGDFIYKLLRDQDLSMIRDEDREEIAHGVNAVLSVQLLSNRIREYRLLDLSKLLNQGTPSEGGKLVPKSGLEAWEQKIAASQIAALETKLGPHPDGFRLSTIDTDLSGFLRFDVPRMIGDIGNTMDDDAVQVKIRFDAASGDFQSKLVKLSKDAKFEGSDRPFSWDPNVSDYLMLGQTCQYWEAQKAERNKSFLPEPVL